MNTITVPVLMDFDPRRPIGWLTVDADALPACATYVFALGFEVRQETTIPAGTVPVAPYPGAYRLHCVGLVEDSKYTDYLRQNGFLGADAADPAPATPAAGPAP